MTTIKEVMTRDVHLMRPDQSIREAAELMARTDVGSLPVSDDDRLIGMLTDRDLALRAVARGLGPETAVRDVMTADIKYCHDHEDVAHVARNMAELGIRRLPVVNAEKRLVGIVALSNIAQSGNAQASESLLDGVAQPH
ncbi:MAG TPA: CBS domain-containing protein [Dokdonella sp.]